MQKFKLLLPFFLFPMLLFGQQKYTVSGYIEDATSSERLVSASVVDSLSRRGALTNNFGYFNLQNTEGVHWLTFSFVGYQSQTIPLTLNQDTVLTVRLSVGDELNTLEVNASKQNRLENTAQMSRVSVPIDQIKRMPMLLGEADVMKTLQLLPGVKAGSEGTSGVYVRGGSPDQNLILLDGVPVYNVSHIAGLFSVFNTDAIRNVSLTKGGFPARFGGRLSSVIEIDMKEGNKKAFHTEGSLGILTSKILVEGPMLKNRASFMVSARRSYLDILLRPFIKDIFDNSTSGFDLFFYDLNAKLNYQVNEKNNLYFSIYSGYDKYELEDYYASPGYGSRTASGFNYGNLTSAFRWNSLINSKMFVNTTLSYSRYQYRYQESSRDTTTDLVRNIRNPTSSDLIFATRVNDISIKSDVDYLLNNQHHIRFGGNIIRHAFTPGSLTLKASGQRDTTYGNSATAAVETMLYAEDELQFDRWRVNGGLNLGRFDVGGKGYTALQPRLSVSYNLGNGMAIKSSYAATSQFIHLLTNDGLSIPSDSWVPSTRIIRPQRAQQVALGFVKTTDTQLELSVETYYKKMSDLVAYREGSDFLSQGQDFESRIVQGRGAAYGAEFFLQKKQGRTTGWIGYTLAWSNRQFDDINDGKQFPYKYDRRHEISIVLSHQLTKRIAFSANWVFATGNAITLPEQVTVVLTPVYGTIAAQRVIEYGVRNSYRAAPTHRLDFGFDFVRKRRRFERKWSVGAYNAYNRANPFYFEIRVQDRYVSSVAKTQTDYQVNQISLIPLLPYVSYSFKF